MKPTDFQSLNLSPALLRTLEEMEFSSMTPIQAASLPVTLAGQDVLGLAQTGSGKTAAYLIPILEKLQPVGKGAQALILCPTRELCEQVLKESRKFAKAIPGFQAVSLIGGQPYPPQAQALHRGVHLVVGTPGRTLEHLKNSDLGSDSLRFLVLDEADRMLDEGFSTEMDAILQFLPRKRQSLLFSATFPEAVVALSRKYQNNAQTISIDDTAGSETKKPAIEQYVYEAEAPEKAETLVRILQRHASMRTLIFCRMKTTVDEVGQWLKKSKVSADILHGDLEQADRDRVMALFRNGSLRILVATDVAARGLDIENLELVINYDLPPTAETYIHRIGRTGRAGQSGVAVSIATSFEGFKMAEIEKTTGVPMIRQSLGFKNQNFLGNEFQETLTKTLQISGGKLDKIRPGDILGTLTSEPSPLKGTDIGKIEIFERFSYVAVQPGHLERALQKLRNSKIKGSKFKIYPV